MGYYSNFLFARPSFAEGVARLLDVGGTLDQYNCSSTPELADRRAAMADWRQVGADIELAAEKEAEVSHIQLGQGVDEGQVAIR